MRKRLRAERLKRRMTQEQVAQQVGISTVTYRKLECHDIPGRYEWYWDELEAFFGVSREKLKAVSPDDGGRRMKGRKMGRV